ncbi:hypothetical protein IU479_27010 [Nocardia abscessus]|uniref:hypothetical protein n=1 Tax=Nocardia abscessus TaxID=120957 RepID=UPI001895DC21|nr:hypothetical protein [Nocardia abscessus]MBF6221751.1 hypothetical protein [Nocardia abscessus]
MAQFEVQASRLAQAHRRCGPAAGLSGDEPGQHPRVAEGLAVGAQAEKPHDHHRAAFG